MEPRWYLVGFTFEEVVSAEQDARLARAAVEAWRAAGCPRGFEIRRGRGEGDRVIGWYVSETAARILDAHGVRWRPFLVGERSAPPSGAPAAVALDRAA